MGFFSCCSAVLLFVFYFFITLNTLNEYSPHENMGHGKSWET